MSEQRIHRTGTALPAGGHGSPWTAWAAYIAFIVYGSLVPLDFQAIPADQAWAAFRQIPMLQLGIESRADWIANGVLYVPAGFLTVLVFGGRGGVLWRLPRLAGAGLFCITLAVAVEFAQLFFPPRTVSLNDVIAEAIGSLLGIILAVYWSDWFHELLAAMAGTLEHMVGRGLQAYAAGYAVFSLFPFDFLLSAGEIAGKVHSDAWGWVLAGQSAERGVIVLAAKLLAEILAVAPIGVMLGRSNELRRRSATRDAILYGGLLGLVIEAAQFFVFSGVSQGASLLTRAAGMYLGALCWEQRQRFRALPVSASAGWLAGWGGAFYLAALLAVNGWFDHRWHGLPAAARTYAETRFLPFYYHYYTTEQAALLSTAAVALMYAPIGGLVWLRRQSPAAASWVALFAAAIVEMSKLFLDGLHPDPTNLLIAPLAAWAATTLLLQLDAIAAARARPTADLGAATATATLPTGRERRSTPDGRWIAWMATLVLVVWVAVDFAFQSFLLAALLLAYAALLWYRPRLLWLVIPAAIPMLDLAPWSGRFFLDEFDFLVMVSLLVGYVRMSAVRRSGDRDRLALAVTWLVALTLACAALRGGLLAFPAPDANAFSNYYSPYNALRIAKGALWALLLFALIPRFEAGGRDIRRLFAGGMVAGLAGVVGAVLWERVAFPGLFNFTDVYRVTGPFSQMHTGGADIEVYLCVAAPFVVLLISTFRTLWSRLAGALLFLGATYALMVTFSRAGYAGYAVALGGASLVALLAPRHGPARSASSLAAGGEGGAGVVTLKRWAVPVGLLALGVVVALPIYSGSFAQERLSRLTEDLAARRAHWLDALAMRDGGLSSTLFGMGLGRFPETHYWRSSEPRAASYRLESDGGKPFLRLGAGLPLYMEQLVAARPHQDYVLHLALRGARPGATLSAALCEKWLLTSGRCASATAAVRGDGKQWQDYEMILPTGGIGAGSKVLTAPVKLSLFNSSAASVDVDKVRLLGSDGQDLIRNGSFARGLDRWFFSVDQDLPWHVWNMPVALVFDQGWVGMVAFAAMMLLGFARSWRATRRGDIVAGCFLAAMAAVAVMAGVDTIIDSPRFMLLLMLLFRLGWSHPAAGRTDPV